jgi:hypothetical protein
MRRFGKKKSRANSETRSGRKNCVLRPVLHATKKNGAGCGGATGVKVPLISALIDRRCRHHINLSYHEGLAVSVAANVQRQQNGVAEKAPIKLAARDTVLGWFL